MCGIVGYVGDKSATEIVLEGLRRLEYRGYDSAGVAVIGPEGLQIRRAAGRIKVLEGILRERPIDGPIGLGHTRWATHGRPTDENAHPHTDGSGDLVVVHNGIIENYLPIKERLQAEGHVFKSETDTEVIAHLIERHLKDTPRLDEAIRRALRELRGSYAIVVLHRRMPDRLVAAKLGAGSVVVGLGENETFLASDIPAILSHTRDVVVLEDEDVAIITRAGRRDHRPRRRPGAAGPEPDPVGPDHGREGRLPSLHAEGDLRAATRRRRHHAGPRPARGGHGGAARRAPRSRGGRGYSTNRPGGLRDLLSRGHRRPLHDGASDRRSRPRSTSAPSSATATRCWARRLS